MRGGAFAPDLVRKTPVLVSCALAAALLSSTSATANNTVVQVTESHSVTGSALSWTSYVVHAGQTLTVEAGSRAHGRILLKGEGSRLVNDGTVWHANWRGTTAGGFSSRWTTVEMAADGQEFVNNGLLFAYSNIDPDMVRMLGYNGRFVNRGKVDNTEPSVTSNGVHVVGGQAGKTSTIINSGEFDIHGGRGIYASGGDAALTSGNAHVLDIDNQHEGRIHSRRYEAVAIEGGGYRLRLRNAGVLSSGNANLPVVRGGLLDDELILMPTSDIRGFVDAGGHEDGNILSLGAGEGELDLDDIGPDRKYRNFQKLHAYEGGDWVWTGESRQALDIAISNSSKITNQGTVRDAEIDIRSNGSLINDGDGEITDARVVISDGGRLTNRGTVSHAEIGAKSGGTLLNEANGRIDISTLRIGEGGTLSNFGRIHKSWIYLADNADYTLDGSITDTEVYYEGDGSIGGRPVGDEREALKAAPAWTPAEQFANNNFYIARGTRTGSRDFTDETVVLQDRGHFVNPHRMTGSDEYDDALVRSEGDDSGFINRGTLDQAGVEDAVQVSGGQTGKVFTFINDENASISAGSGWALAGRDSAAEAGEPFVIDGENRAGASMTADRVVVGAENGYRLIFRNFGLLEARDGDDGYAFKGADGDDHFLRHVGGQEIGWVDGGDRGADGNTYSLFGEGEYDLANLDKVRNFQNFDVREQSDVTWTGETDQEGEWRVRDNSRLTNEGKASNLSVLVDQGSSYGGEGEIGWLTVSGVLSPGGRDGIGEVNVAHDLTLKDGAVYEVTVSNTEADLVKAGGRIIIEDGAEMEVVGKGSLDIDWERRYTVMEAGEGIEGEFSAIRDDFAFYSSRAEYEANSVEVILRRTKFEEGQIDPNSPVEGILSLPCEDTDDPDLKELCGGIWNVADGDRDKMLRRLTGELNVRVQGEIVDSLRMTGAAIDRRFSRPHDHQGASYTFVASDAFLSAELADGRRATPVADLYIPRDGDLLPADRDRHSMRTMLGSSSLRNGPPPARSLTLWVNGIGAYARNKDQANSAYRAEKFNGHYAQHSGFTARTFGAVAGAEYQVNNEVLVGLAGTYLRRDVEMTLDPARAKIDLFAGSAYIGYRGDAFWVGFSGGYGYGSIDQTRQLTWQLGGQNGTFNRTAKADYAAHSVYAMGSTGYRIDLGQTTLEPFANLYWGRTWVDGYTETGAGSANQTVAGKTVDTLSSGLGLRAAWAVALDGGTLTPEISGMWLRRWVAPEQRAVGKMIAATQGHDVALPGADRDAAVVGAGLGFASVDAWAMNLGYQLEWSKHRSDHRVNLGLSYAW